MKPPYLKPSLSYEEQTQLLKLRNLTISNEVFCTKKLQHINYYRLSAYFHPFYEEKNSFKDDTKFEDILQLYYFDKEFRNLLFYSIEKIEVYMRTQLAYVISQNSGVFGYTDSSIFHDEEKYRRKILREIDIKPFVFENWLHTLTYVRNICAHHSRIWNKMLAIEPKKPRNQKTFSTLNSKKIFFVIAMILFMLEKIDDEEFNFKNELKRLVAKYPNIDLKAMGFIDEWEEIVLCK